MGGDGVDRSGVMGMKYKGVFKTDIWFILLDTAKVGEFADKVDIDACKKN
jgi:hypothetical protein